jgi:hypothetical protein
VIPDDAVEAAVAAILNYKHTRGIDNQEKAMRAALEAAAPHLMAAALTAAALDFELSPHNSRAKMARHFNNAYVAKLRARAEEVREQE